MVNGVPAATITGDVLVKVATGAGVVGGGGVVPVDGGVATTASGLGVAGGLSFLQLLKEAAKKHKRDKAGISFFICNCLRLCNFTKILPNGQYCKLGDFADI